MDFNRNLELVKELIEKSHKIVITSHINPDGDAIGSSLALCSFLKELNKSVRIINYSKTPDLYSFLKDSDIIQLFGNDNADYLVNADLIIILDLNDATRLRTMSDFIIQSNAKKIVIDHHLEPKEFADYYLMDTNASSTGEIVYKLLDKFKIKKLTKEIAESLYVAIMTDSGNFRFPRTNAELFIIASDLIKAGADPVFLYDMVYNRNSKSAIRLLGKCYIGAEYYFDSRLCFFLISSKDFEETGANEDDIEYFAEKILSIAGVEIGILMTEIKERNEIRTSFRSKGELSVRDIAVQYGGGGHFHAAGARVNGIKLNEFRDIIINDIKKIFEN